MWFVVGETKTLACLSPWYQPALSKVKSFMHARLLKNTYYARLAHVEICRETTYVAGWGITKTKFIHGSKIQVKWLALFWDFYIVSLALQTWICFVNLWNVLTLNVEGEGNSRRCPSRSSDSDRMHRHRQLPLPSGIHNHAKSWHKIHRQTMAKLRAKVVWKTDFTI